MKKIIVLTTFFLSIGFYAQVKAPQASPEGKIEQKVGLTDVSVSYSRPSMRNRKIFGDLVPFGKIWRAGANKNTTISFSDNVVINDTKIPHGTYALYIIPNPKTWEVIFYKDTENWGVPKDWDKDKIALSVNAEVTRMPFPMETYTIVIDELTNNSAALNFLWENSVVILPFEVPTEEKTMQSIKTTLNGKPKAEDFYAAANYYYEEDKDPKQALEWITKATDISKEKPFWMLRKKALIEAQNEDYKAAIKSAQASLKSAEKANNEDYIKMNKASIEEWKKK